MLVVVDVTQVGALGAAGLMQAYVSMTSEKADSPLKLNALCRKLYLVPVVTVAV